MQCISLVLNIHSTLRLIFDNPDNIYGFVGIEDDNGFLNGRSPLEVMAQGCDDETAGSKEQRH